MKKHAQKSRMENLKNQIAIVEILGQLIRICRQSLIFENDFYYIKDLPSCFFCLTSILVGNKLSRIPVEPLITVGFRPIYCPLNLFINTNMVTLSQGIQNIFSNIPRGCYKPPI